MISLNERAWQRLERVIKDESLIGISTRKMECGTCLIDAGVNVPGGLDAGLTMAEVGMSDLGTAQLAMTMINENPWPSVVVRTDHPLQACYLSQAAHWPVQMGSYRAMGSGPACLLNKGLDLGKPFAFEESSDCAVLVLETRQLPDEEACLSLAESCRVKPEKLTLLVAPTSSLAGSVQIAARSIETGLHKLQTLGFNLRLVVSGMGQCPISAPTGDDFTAIGKANDMIMSASRVWLSVRDVTDSILEDIISNLPAATSPSYGPPFLDTLKKAGGFYEIDPGLFAPAEVTLVNFDSGNAFHAGSVNVDQFTGIMKGK